MLSIKDYTFYNSICWGNSKNHYNRFLEGSFSCLTLTHLVLAIIEALPFVGQFISLIEQFAGRIYYHNTREPDTSAAMEIANNPLQIQAEKVNRFITSLKEFLVFHGTSAESAASIKEEGMVLSKKRDGCTKQMNEKTGFVYGSNIDAEARNYNYIAYDARHAAEYAKLYPNPEVIIIFLPEHKLGHDISRGVITEDPKDRNALRVACDIDSKYILSCDSAGKRALEIFQESEGELTEQSEIGRFMEMVFQSIRETQAQIDTHLQDTSVQAISVIRNGVPFIGPQ